MIFKMARDRTEDGRDAKRGAVIKDNNGRIITESKELLRIWATYFKAAERKMISKCFELQSSVRKQVEVEEIGLRKKWKQQYTRWKGKATGADELRLEIKEMAGEVGVKWTCSKAAERVYAGKDTEGVEDGPDSAYVEEESA